MVSRPGAPARMLAMTLRGWIVIFAAGLAGCRTAAPPLTAQGPAVTPPAVTAPAAGGPAVEPDSIKWVRQSAEYRAAVTQTYRLAAAHVERAVARRGVGPWAVVLDADETILSNLTYQAERARAGLPFTAESWAAWVRRRAATTLPGAAAFLSRVRELGGGIAIVTNRLASECDDTIAVFAREALPYDAMLCRPDGTPSDKNPRFELVQTGKAPGIPVPVTVIAYLGDNIQDFPGLGQQTVNEARATALALFGERYFVLPNPMYGSWQ